MQVSAATIPKMRHDVFKRTSSTTNPTWSFFSLESMIPPSMSGNSRRLTNPESISHFSEITFNFSSDTLKTRGVKVVLMTPNPLRWTPRLRELYGKPPYHPEDPEGMNRLLHTYAAAVRELALEESVALVDVDAAFRDYARGHGTLDDLLLDGMHPNQQGQRIVAEMLGKTVVDLLGLR